MKNKANFNIGYWVFDIQYSKNDLSSRLSNRNAMEVERGEISLLFYGKMKCKFNTKSTLGAESQYH